MKSRRSIRLPRHSYGACGYYFITIRCERHAPALCVIDGDVRLTDIGRIVDRCWNDLSGHFASIELDEFIIMPDHIHGIIRYSCSIPDARSGHAGGTLSGSIGAIVQSFKSLSTRRANRKCGTKGSTLWQRNYYESVILTDRRLAIARAYIRDNPIRWKSNRR